MMLSVQLCYAQKQEWKSLFNGRNLDGWDTYLRATDMSGYYLDSTKTYLPPIGVNKDPLKVFTIVNNAIRVSGEIWGAFTSKAQYSNYHIRFQTKWGVKKWPPRDGDDVYRDAGFLFHCSGPFDYAFNCWMRSLEFNIQEGEFGDFTDVHAGMPELRTSPGKTLKGKDIDQYDMSGVFSRTASGRSYRSGNFESPYGEWTTNEAIIRQADAVFIVNGFVVNRLFNIWREDLKQQTQRGKIQFQSEGAEVFYRNIEMRPLSFKQSFPKLVPDQQKLSLIPGQSQQVDIVNNGEAVEIIAAELIGRNIESVIVKLPKLPLVLKKATNLNYPFL